jgi:predicted dehydrogenase
MSVTVNKIQPLIVGRGMAGQALRHALAMYPDDVNAPLWLDRGAPIPEPDDPATALIVVAGPHALHTPRLLEAAGKGYRYAITEKPAAVDLEQVERLESLPIETWVCHGYRMLWGPTALRDEITAGSLGQVFAIEGRYWQSSAAHESRTPSWKDDTSLGGRFDVLLDLAAHWADLVTFVTGRMPASTSVRRWFVNAASPHRDTHVHLRMEHESFTSFGSISKTVHGTGNQLELTVLGAKATATWEFLNPDVILWGEGPSKRTEVRTGAELPSRPAPFHGLGWMEGYGRIVGQVVAHMRRGTRVDAADLKTHLRILSALLEAAEAELRR